VSSLFLIAEPLFWEASIISLNNLSDIVLFFLFLVASNNHLKASVCDLFIFTSTGTWYVAPPTLLDLTSRLGRILFIASLKILIGSSLVLSLICLKAV